MGLSYNIIYTLLYYGGFMRFKDLSGQKFGQLTVLERIPKQIGRTVKWRCKCNCGNITIVTRSNLISGCTQSCGQHRFFNLENQQFGRLIVVEKGNGYKHKNGTMITWICKCNCGNYKEILGMLLLSGRTRSCGCLAKQKTRERRFTGYQQISGKYWSSIRGAANRRQLIFDIDIKYIWNLYIKQNKLCALSGLPIEFNLNNKLTTASIDRIDNNKGYTKNNVQLLHKKVNIMKNNLVQKNFIDICKAIAKNGV